jgi:apolipoprotein N-acyltransferase
MPPQRKPNQRSAHPLEKLTAGWRGDLLSLLAGALVTLSLAPFGIWPAGLVAAFLMRALLQGQQRRAVLWRSWLFGVGLFGSGTSWVYVSIHEHGYAPVPLALLLVVLFTLGLALFNLLAGWIYSLTNRRNPASNWLLFPATMVLGEWLKSWLFTGFPWLFFGYAHIDTPLAGWAPLGGVLAVSFFLTLSGSLLFEIYTSERRRQWALAALLGGIWLVGGLLRTVDWVEPAGEPLSIGMIQPDISQASKWQPGAFKSIISNYMELSSGLWDSDIVIWPEAAIPRLYQNAQPLIAQLDARARRSQATLITGIPYRLEATGEKPGALYNSVVALGEGEGIYYKQHLVPFGEYVPLEHWLRGLIGFFDLPMSNFSWGPADQPPLRAGDWTLAPFVCYEVVYPALVAHDTRRADFILTISNDSWFGRSIGPHQHFEIARMRALENGRYLLRGTNNGISGIVDHRGQVMQSAEQFTRTVLRGEAVPMRGVTPYGRGGNTPLIGSLLLLIIFVRWRSSLAAS